MSEQSMIPVTCGSCGKSMSAPPHLAGATVKCRGCGAHVTIPAAGAAAGYEATPYAPADPQPAAGYSQPDPYATAQDPYAAQQSGYPQQQYPQQPAYPPQQAYPQQGYPQQAGYPQTGYAGGPYIQPRKSGGGAGKAVLIILGVLAVIGIIVAIAVFNSVDKEKLVGQWTISSGGVTGTLDLKTDNTFRLFLSAGFGGNIDITGKWSTSGKRLVMKVENSKGMNPWGNEIPWKVKELTDTKLVFTTADGEETWTKKK